jgi:uncharacterized protein (DUF169 family)
MKLDMAEYEKFYEWLGLKEHPLAAFYSNEKPEGVSPSGEGRVCMFGLLKKARQKGETVYFDETHQGCLGGAYYMGFRTQAMPNIEYFLSCGIPGQMEGERYIKTPELAREYFTAAMPRKAAGTYCVFKPINRLSEAEESEVIVFFASPDLLSGLFTLTNYAAGRSDGVRVPFSSGCGSILTHPLKEGEKEKPQAILGLLDVSARPLVEPNVLTLAMPKKLFLSLLANLDESFLITKSWKTVRERIRK